MKKTVILFLLCPLLFAVNFNLYSKIIPIETLTKPKNITVTDDYIYITEDLSVNIFEKKTLKLVKKFGKKGEGPGEFKLYAIIYPLKDKILINSYGKFSYYTKRGELLKEIETSKFAILAPKPIGSNFLAMKTENKDNEAFRSLHLFDGKFKIIKEIERQNSFITKSGKISILKDNLAYETKGKIGFVSNGRTFFIKIINEKGEVTKTIKREYKKIEFTDEDRKKVIEEFKNDPQTKPFINIYLKRIVFPDYYPVIAGIRLDNKYAYIMTFKRVKDKYEFFIYDHSGKFIKRDLIHFFFQTRMQPYPSDIHNGTLYQLVDNDDEEIWELHIDKII